MHKGSFDLMNTKPTYSLDALVQNLKMCSRDEFERLFQLVVKEKELYTLQEYTKALILFSRQYLQKLSGFSH